MKCVSVAVSVGVCLSVAMSCVAWPLHVIAYDVDYEPEYDNDSGEDDVLLNTIPGDDDGPWWREDKEEEIPELPEIPVEPEATTPTTVAEEDLSERLDKLTVRVKALEDTIAELEKTNKKLSDQVDVTEEQSKTNSLIFFNIRDNKRESYKATLHKVLLVINRIMKVRLEPADISVALRVNGNQTLAHRPIAVRFTNFASKMMVLGAQGRLAGTNIQVVPDYSQRVVQTRALLLPYLEAARSRGQRAYLLYDALMVDGERKTLAELQAENPPVDAREDSPPDEQVEEVEVDPDHQDREDFE